MTLQRGLTTQAQLAKFLAKVGIALRYGPNAALPLASIYQAVARGDEPEQEAQRRAAILTNAVIDDEQAIETNTIAKRLTLVTRALAPAVVALARAPRDRQGGAQAHRRPGRDHARRWLSVGCRPRAAQQARSAVQQVVIQAGASCSL